MNAERTIIRFDNVTVALGDEAVYDRLSFSVREGEFLCILGPSGCGKSTALRVIGDLLDRAGGEIVVDGRTPTEAWGEIAFVFQSPRLAPWRSALGNVLLGMELRFGRGDRRRREARARELLALVGLERDMEKYPAMLSGGERQRVAIARALAVDPKIVLMDEPFSALDLNTRRRLRAEIEEVWRRTGKTVVFVTHDIDEALTLADRIILLSAKPTRVLETIVVDEPRPRAVAASARLQNLRARLVELFGELEEEAVSS
ncbi:MAG: ABC transporter ATP-binding protein [Rhodospirillales bacterium]|nr:ABC transporter ATP-binding protein [Rhodospirillales bacterium]